MSTQHDELLDPAVLVDIEHRPIDDVRSLRSRCIDVETGLSYLRRMVQAPLDIVIQEQRRRTEGGGPTDLATLIGDLPEVLSPGTRSFGVPRLPTQLEPSSVDPELSAELDRLVGEGQLASIVEMDDAQLEHLHGLLSAYERRVSERRRAFHSRIDALQAELTRRYRTGEATVESLLH